MLFSDTTVSQQNPGLALAVSIALMYPLPWRGRTKTGYFDQ